MANNRRVRNGREARTLRKAKADDRNDIPVITVEGEQKPLTTEDKIARLDARLGVGVGAVKERARLAKNG